MRTITTKKQNMQSPNNSDQKAKTKMDIIEKIYGKDFGTRNNKKLGSYLKEIGYRSLSKLLKND